MALAMVKNLKATVRQVEPDVMEEPGFETWCCHRGGDDSRPHTGLDCCSDGLIGTQFERNIELPRRYAKTLEGFFKRRPRTRTRLARDPFAGGEFVGLDLLAVSPWMFRANDQYQLVTSDHQAGK